jgi:hypothetical protein
MAAYEEFKEVWGGLPSISPHTEEAPGYTTGRVLSAMKIDADEIAAKDARIAALESALEPFAELGRMVKSGNLIPLKMTGLGPEMVWIEASDCVGAHAVLCHASPEQADGSVSPDKPALHPGDGETR